MLTLATVPLNKVIEFPLFHLGTFTSQNGTPVPFTESLLKQIEKNTNFILKSKVLQAPIGYDHPSQKSDAHGTLVGLRYDKGVLYGQGDNWSDTLVADAKAKRRLAYSGELAPNFSFPDGAGKMVDVGPAVVGMAILGASRPAIKNLKPLSEFEFAEGTAPADAYLIREELRSAGLVSQHVDGQHYFGEIENDERRFFSEERQEQESTMTDAEIKAAIAEGIKSGVSTAVAEAVAPLKAEIKNFSEESKRISKADELVTKLSKEKPIGKIALDAYRVALLEPTEANVQAFAEKLPAFIAPGGRAGAPNKGAEGGEGGEGDADEPKALAKIRPKHFAEIDNPASQAIIDEALIAFSEFKPDAFKGVEQNPGAQIDRLRTYVTTRDTAATN